MISLSSLLFRDAVDALFGSGGASNWFGTARIEEICDRDWTRSLRKSAFSAVM